ncbi:MAG: CDP-glycerol glycerophosphotransferase family protein, partial [Patescibacteria group bacterium]
MKTILAKFDNSFFVRNFLRAGTFEKILNRGDIRFIFLVPKEKLEYYRKEFPQSNILFDILPEIKKSKIERFFNLAERFSIHTHTVYMIFRSEFEKTKNLNAVRRAGVFILKFILWRLGRFSFWRRFLRKIYFLVPSAVFSGFFKKYKPDLVFAPYMVFTDHAFIKEAQKAEIATLGMTLSWDNLYSKTFLLSHPDNLIVQTRKIEEQAETMGDYRGKIFVCGIPQYDRHFSKQGVVAREEFFKKIGADPKKKLVVYAFSGKQGLRVDFDILSILNDARNGGNIVEDIEILARPYPRTDFPGEKLERLKKDYGILATQSTAHVGFGDADWEFDEESISTLENTLAHADIVITMYSTFFIEAAIFDKPLIGASFDGRKKLPYWDSASRFFEWDHLRDIKTLNGIWLVKNKEELVGAVNKYLKDPGFLKEGREKLVRKQVGFADAHSAQRVADVIIKLCFLSFSKK